MKYHTIVADPAWPYKDAGKESSTLVKPDASRFRMDGTESTQVNNWTYKPMSMLDIIALPVKDLAEDNAHLYLWTTNAFMVEAHQVAKAWGFEQKTIITWGKVHQDDHLKPSMKTGYYYRGATEHCLFCVRGSQKTSGTWPTLFLWPRIGEHSVKPEAFIDLVEQASPGPYVELFSRRHRMGWDVWGTDSANTAELIATDTV